MKLKVCGMKNPANIREVAALRPDYLGFIFHKPSARCFVGEIPALQADIKTTGVFVNATLEKVLDKVRKHDLKAVQLHGDEDPDYLMTLREQFGQFPGNPPVELLKVFSVDGNFDLKELEPFEGKADFFLFDTRGKKRGGNGIAFNWDLLLDYNSPTPFFLSGGIGPEDTEKIKAFVERLHQKGKTHLLRGLDVNSRFESEPGLKKPEELKFFQHQLAEYFNTKHL